MPDIIRIPQVLFRDNEYCLSIMANHPVPKTSISTLKDVIEGYYETAEAGTVVEDEDVAGNADAGKDVITRQKKFLADIGVLEKDGYDYMLLEEGNSLGRALAYEREEDAIEVIEELLNEWEVTEQLLTDLDSESHSKEHIVDSLAYLTETDASTSRKQTGLNALVDMYAWSGIIDETGDDQYIPAESSKDEEGEEMAFEEHPATDDDPKDENPVKEDSSNQEPEQPNPPEYVALDNPNSENDLLSIKLELSGDEDPENVRNLIIAIREGFETDLDEEEGVADNSDSEKTAPLTDFS